jgi:amino acid adenylation domain-containing protein
MSGPVSASESMQARLEIEQRLLARGGGRNAIPRRPAGERMFLLERMLPDVAAYNVPRVFRVRGHLDEDVLQQAFDVVSSRHEVLRTGIVLEGGVPTQRVHDEARIRLEVHDLRARPAAELDDVIEDVAWRRFDLERGALVRAALLRLEEVDVLVVVSHHLASDHASGAILLRELVEVYDAVREQRTPSLPELPIQYADYATWQRERFDGALLDDLVGHWRTVLDGAAERFDLPADRPRPPAKTYAGDELRFALPIELADAIRAYARSTGTSVFTVLLTAFYALLHRYTESEDIVVGVPISGRHHEETQELIGYFSNTLALRAHIDRDLTFAELLNRVRAVANDAYAHQELPFERLVEALNPRRDPSHTPVFQVLLSHDLVSELPMLGGLQLEPQPLRRWPYSRFDLAVGTLERPDGGLEGVVEYSTDLFDAGTIERFAGHLTTLLAGVVREPGLPIAALTLLPEGERAWLIEERNRTESPVDPRCLHELVAEHARRTPDRVAVEGSARSLTYGDLDARANQLARHLLARGIGGDDLVGVCLDRSPETMVAMLATLKTGAAYVPIDPTYPHERQAFMLADANARVLLTEQSLLDALPPAGDAEIVCIDRDWPEIASLPDAPPEARADPESVAYVIYTSGSTGRPKGVEIRHRSVVNLLGAMQVAPGVTSDDVVVNVTTSAFDLSVPDLYLPLVSGAKLVILPRNQAQDPPRLATALDEVGATFMQATPTTWRLLVDAGWQGRRGLKIVCGGEALPHSLAAVLHDRGESLWHMYGPTETTVWSSAMRLTRSEGPPPIGGPIANTRFYLVDDRLQPVPVGVPGELLIGGVGVARGYRGRPDLTAEKFVADPFVTDAHERVYRTGDRMRLRSDGTLEFIGRIDHQVKLHGYRIELGEIEVALDAHADVRQSVAVVAETDDGDKRLVAYVVPSGDALPTQDVLRHHLAEYVPAYMLPSAIVVLDELPRTANGKLDVKALPRPEATRDRLQVEYVAPATPVEELLAEIWADLLGVDRVGANDDFFDLGGHSLLAVRMLARIHDTLGVELFLTSVFEHPELRALAESVGEQLLADTADDDLAAVLRELEAEEAT